MPSKVKPKPCAVCEKMYLPSMKYKKCCSDECKAEHERRRVKRNNGKKIRLSEAENQRDICETRTRLNLSCHNCRFYDGCAAVIKNNFTASAK